MASENFRPCGVIKITFDSGERICVRARSIGSIFITIPGPPP